MDCSTKGDPWKSYSNNEMNKHHHQQDNNAGATDGDIWNNSFKPQLDVSTPKALRPSLSSAKTPSNDGTLVRKPIGEEVDEEEPYWRSLEQKLQKLKRGQKQPTSKEILKTLALAKASHDESYINRDEKEEDNFTQVTINPTVADRLYHTNSIYRHAFPQHCTAGNYEGLPLVGFDEIQLRQSNPGVTIENEVNPTK